jgi:FkbM family methyltransferase
MNVKNAIKSVPLLGGLAQFLRSIQLSRLHAQFESNTILFRRYCTELSQVVSNPVFVKVGANDGVTGDPISDILMTDIRWKGLLIEPVPYCFARLKANFSDSARFTLEQAAVGHRALRSTFYYVGEEAREAISDLPAMFDQLGSFDRHHIVKHLDGVLEPFIMEIEVEVLPLSEILQRNHIQDCHLLLIDTEGYDYKVLRSLDFSVTSPVAIFIEHKHLAYSERKDLIRLLQAASLGVV